MASSVGISLSNTATSRRARLAQLLTPLDNGPQEIRALDGLRAIAALSIFVFHTLLLLQFEYTPQSRAIGNLWYYLATGVQLFFVLSGFLLFLPYARAMLDARPLPSAKRFYQRRALRILPAYYVCLAATAILESIHKGISLDPANLLMHLLFLHDTVPQFNRDYNGPFWTLAVEFQFYLMLPLVATIIARVVGRSRSPRRLVGAILGLMAVALVIRSIAVAVMNTLPMGDAAGSEPGGIFVLVMMGMQGKHLEVFGIGMLCSVAYVALGERRAQTSERMRRIGAGLVVVALVLIAVAMPYFNLIGLLFVNARGYGADLVLYPLVIGLGYGALLLGVLWTAPAMRAPFEWRPLRMIGLMSYSLYLWHLPVINASVPGFDQLAIPLRLIGAFLVAYLSYQLVERPFLLRRARARGAAAPPAPAHTAPEPTVVHEDPEGVAAAVR